MKLTTKGNYAISALIELATKKDENHTSLSDIANKLDLSENYLRQLFLGLKKSGIVGSVRGVSGGYYFAKELSEITVLDIVEAVEGKVNVVPCLDGDTIECCPRIDQCRTRDVWMDLNTSVVDGLEELNLRNLLDEFEKDKES